MSYWVLFLLSVGLRLTHDFGTASQVFINFVASFFLLLHFEREKKFAGEQT